MGGITSSLPCYSRNGGEGMDIFALLRTAASKGASDLHLVVSSPPLLRVNGLLEAVNGTRPLTANEINQAFLQITTPEQRESFHHNLELDFNYSLSEVGQLRCNAAQQRGAISLAVRLLPAKIPTIEELELPAIYKELALKQSVFKELDEKCMPHTILATNTSTISITAIASATKRPQKVIGLHFAAPVPVMKGVEIVRGLDTSDKTLEIAKKMVYAIGKEFYVGKDGPGFVGNRIFPMFLNETFNLLWEEHEKTGTPYTILTNQVSDMINNITDNVYRSELHKNKNVRDRIIAEYTPKSLLKLIGLENIKKRAPEIYLSAIVATRIATNFVYSYGLGANEVDFFNYLNSLASRQGSS